MKILQRMLLTWMVVMVTTVATIPNAHANDPAAVVIVATGEFYAVNTQLKKRVLKRRSKVFVGETLMTGKNGRGQVRFIDGAVLSLRPDTELEIKKYAYGKASAEEGSWMNLLKGGFRTITGAIGKKKYKVTTNMATIGIRGTHYSAVIHQEQLYVALWDGGVTLSNSAGEVDLGLGADYNYGMVQSDTVEPQGQIDPPAAIVNESQPEITPDLSKASDAESTTIESDQQVPLAPQPYSAPEPIMPTSGFGNYTVNTVTSPAVGSVTATGSTSSIDAFTLSANVNFADASMTGSLSATTTSTVGGTTTTNNWSFTSLSGGFTGSTYSMSGTGTMASTDPATASITGSFAGPNAEFMTGDFVLSSAPTSTTETGSFTSGEGTKTP